MDQAASKLRSDPAAAPTTNGKVVCEHGVRGASGITHLCAAEGAIKLLARPVMSLGRPPPSHEKFGRLDLRMRLIGIENSCQCPLLGGSAPAAKRSRYQAMPSSS